MTPFRNSRAIVFQVSTRRFSTSSISAWKFAVKSAANAESGEGDGGGDGGEGGGEEASKGGILLISESAKDRRLRHLGGESDK